MTDDDLKAEVNNIIYANACLSTMSTYDKEVVYAILLRFAKQQRGVGMEQAAKVIENGHFLSTESLEYKWGMQAAAAIRREAHAKALEGG